MRGESHNRNRSIRIASAGALVLLLCGCETFDDVTGTGRPVSAEEILLRKAEDRVVNAQDSLNDANNMIARGQRQRAEGEQTMKQGDARIRAGMTLKAEAERDLAAARNQAATARQSVQIHNPTEEGAAAAPVPQSRPVSINPY